MKFLKTSIIIIISYLFISSSTADFNYRDTRSWARKWPACGGSRQSPVDFPMHDLDDSQRSHKLKFTNYGVTPRRVMLHNIGWTVQVTFEWEDDRVPSISGGFFNGTYRLDTWIFHWDTRSNNGSEHTVDGISAAMELQHFYYKTEYGSVAEAANHEDGLIILGDFLYTEKLKNDSVESEVFRQFLTNFPSVARPGSTASIKPFTLLSLVYPGANDIIWIVYYGSLTIPPCTENAMWLMNTYTHIIDKNLMRNIQTSIQFATHDDHNNREIQPLNGRRLYMMSAEPVT